jgi:hypothetical protein
MGELHQLEQTLQDTAGAARALALAQALAHELKVLARAERFAAERPRPI